jgi:hypothetical protein
MSDWFVGKRGAFYALLVDLRISIPDGLLIMRTLVPVGCTVSHIFTPAEVRHRNLAIIKLAESSVLFFVYRKIAFFDIIYMSILCLTGRFKMRHHEGNERQNGIPHSMSTIALYLRSGRSHNAGVFQALTNNQTKPAHKRRATP